MSEIPPVPCAAPAETGLVPSVDFVNHSRPELAVDSPLQKDSSAMEYKSPYSRPLCLLVLSLAIAGCSTWDLGSQPSNFVGPGGSSQPLTDPGLQAVVPKVPGDDPNAPPILPLPATAPAATQRVTPANAPLADRLSVQEAILAGLEHNIGLRVDRLNVPITRTTEESRLAAFDPTISGSIEGGRTVSGGEATDVINGSVTATEKLPTGTTIEGKLSSSNNFYSDSRLSTGANLSVTQSLLRGAGLDVNLASLRSAQLATRISQYQLRNSAETLVADIELSYWDLAYAEQQVVIVRNALDVAQKQLDDTRQRVNVQRLAPSELPAAEAEVASRREAIINADSTLETTRLRFLQRLAPANREFWNQTVSLTTLPFIPTGTMDPVDTHVDVAMKFRPDINQTKLQLQQGDLELVVTRNGLLPRLDAFVRLAKTGESSNFGNSLSNTFDNSDYAVTVGVSGDWQPINRAARATYRASELSQEQLQESLDNQSQQVQLDIRTQYIEVTRTRLQIDATRATRQAREADLNVQQGRLAAGNGTSLLVAIAQRDLLSAQLSEVQAVTNHLKSLVTLYSLEGTLLLRRGLSAPGASPITRVTWAK